MKFLITFFILLSFLNVGAQNIPFTKVLNFDTAILKFRNDYPQEKVFLQTDKSHYLSGETIWMKTWVTSDGLPSFLSRILYIDIVDFTGKVILKKMFHLDNASSTAADFDIPRNLTSGNYSINAYTLWMKNFPDFKQNNTAIAAFGATTANAVVKHNLRLDVHAPHPKAPSMVGAIELFIKDQLKKK